VANERGYMNISAWDFRISLTEAGLQTGSLMSYDIPMPNLAPFLDSSVEMGRSDGGQALHGFINDGLMWDRIMMRVAFRLRKFIDDARSGTGELYLTVPMNDASHSGWHWLDVKGMPHRPRQATDSGDMGIRMPGGLQYVDDFVLLLNNITIINDPSVYTVL
jgi:hypothetical protein